MVGTGRKRNSSPIPRFARLRQAEGAMDLWTYRLEIVATVVVIVSGIIVTMVVDYLLNHNKVLRESIQDDSNES